ncbi:MAG: alpha/beta hydrolase [Phycisphaerae bacterium]|nr:alpha/beta hydrolase [Phycisphaerae bacterium]
MVLIGVTCLATTGGCNINDFVLFPDRKVTANPDAAGLRHVDIVATNAAGRRIEGWLVLPAGQGPPRGTVLISHGNAGNVGSFLPWAKMLAEAGYAAALYDYQGYGASEGEADVNSLVGDGAAVVAWLREHGYVGDAAGSTTKRGAEDGPARHGRKLGLLGLSLGTLVSVRLAATMPDLVGAVVLEGSMIPGEELKRKFGVLGAPVAWVLTQQIPAELDTGTQIQAVRCPVLFLHSTTDEVTSFEGGRELFALAREPKQWVQAEGLAHLRLLFDWPPYSPTVVGWFDRHLIGGKE